MINDYMVHNFEGEFYFVHIAKDGQGFSIWNDTCYCREKNLAGKMTSMSK